MRTRAEARPSRAEEEQTVRLARKRFARRQWARRWLAWRVVLAVVAVLAAVASVVWLVFFSSVLAVKGVQVEGAAVLDPRDVRRVAAVPTGSPLAGVDLDEVAERVEALAPVLDVDVSRAWPSRIRIDVTERVAVAVVDQGGVLHGVDEEGVMFRRYPSRPPSLPLLRIGAATQADALAEAARVVESLPRDIASRVEYVSVTTVDTISLRLRSGQTVQWGSADESGHKAEVLAVLLEQKASLYDVTVPGQPVIRP
ncbi:MAG: cell division protein FtsQ/DivIB [Nocardioides sp.]